MSFYDPEKNYTFLLSPREISFINRNIRKDNNLVKKLRATTVYQYGKEIPVEQDYIPLNYTHPHFEFYSHINDIYCFKVYSPLDIIKYNQQNNTQFCPLLRGERPLKKAIYEKPHYPKYDEEGNKILFSGFTHLITKQGKQMLSNSKTISV
jgi:hypothetical protein